MGTGDITSTLTHKQEGTEDTLLGRTRSVHIGPGIEERLDAQVELNKVVTGKEVAWVCAVDEAQTNGTANGEEGDNTGGC